MKVLLFVQGEGGRVKSVGGNHRPYNDSATARAMWLHGIQQTAVCVSGGRRWWLVECENAEAGRRVIQESNAFANLRHTGFAPTPGRILASGGKGVA